jgi:hypothetical protein
MKTILTVSVAALVAANAQILNREDRAPHTVDVWVSRNGRMFGFEATWDATVSTSTDPSINVVRATFTDEQTLWAVQSDLQRELIQYEVEVCRWGTLRVKVLDLLDTHWRLFQLINEPLLKIDAPDGTEHLLTFNNNGETVCAEFEGTEDNAEEYARLINSLKAMHTPYEIV